MCFPVASSATNANLVLVGEGAQQLLADDGAQHRIAQELEPLVRLVHAAARGQRRGARQRHAVQLRPPHRGAHEGLEAPPRHVEQRRYCVTWFAQHKQFTPGVKHEMKVDAAAVAVMHGDPADRLYSESMLPH